MKMNRTTAILATIGAAAAGFLVAVAFRRMGGGNGPRGAALADGEQHATKDFSTTRSAGPDAMRDKPREWTTVDQAVDESFPASDPPPVNSRID
jgi:hypothetical protein